MNKILYHKKIVFFSQWVAMAFVLFLIPLRVDASILSVTATTPVVVGDRVSIDISVDSEQVSINSVASQVVFSSEYLQFNGFSVTQSSIPVWVEEPKERSKGVVSFSGVIPGGLERLYDPLNTNNTAIPVVRLFFITKKTGQTTLSLGDSLVLRNDGKGTPTGISTTPATVTIRQGGARTVAATLTQDTTPPQPFVVSIVERSLFGKTPRLAVFAAEDLAGGIDHYELSVGSLSFARVISPAPLPYRLFPYVLTVRAFDYSGNMQEQQITVSAENTVFIKTSLLLVFGILVGFLTIRFYNKRRS